MKKFLKYFVVFAFFFSIFLPVNAKEENSVTLYLFHGDGCPHCASEIEFLDSIKDDYSNFKVEEFEVWYHSENEELMEQVKSALGVKKNGVPFTVIGNTYIYGYQEGATDAKIKRAIEYYQENEYEDIVEQVKNGTFQKEENIVDPFSEKEKKSDEESTISVPIIGKVNLKNVSLTSAAVLIGLIDGFNPCALWVLLFLISMLIGMKDKKRMWTLGITFLVTSALVYMVIMLSWLNVVVSISTSILIRNIIAVVALVGGIINLRSFYQSQDSGCHVVDEKKRKKIFQKIKVFTKEKSFILAMLGVIGLAVSVNLVELACSAGLPLIFTQLLAINDVVGIEAFFYTVLYIIFFLLDDLIIFMVAMFTMKVTGLSTKYTKYSHLVGGILMILIGILLILKPEWLMFGGI